MTSPLDEAVERLRDNALFIPGWTPPTDFRVSVRLDDLRTILNALSPDEERVARAHSPETWRTIDELRSEEAWYRSKIGEKGYPQHDAIRLAEEKKSLADRYEADQLKRARAAIQSIVGER